MLKIRLIKKIIFFTSICFIVNNAMGQSILEKYISIPQNTGSTEELLLAIEEETQITFSYSNKVCLEDSIVLSTNRNSIEGFINEIFKNCPVEINPRKNKIIITPAPTQAEEKFVIKGFINNIKNGEVLIGASIYDSHLWQGTSSNNFGFYSLTLPKGEIILNCSFIGFSTQQHRFTLTKDTTLNFNLIFNNKIKEIPVVSYLGKDGINTSRTSTVNVPVEQLQKFPSFLGEVDVIKTLQLLPGINSGSEGASGLFVRGGSVDQNLYLLDDVPVYNISHLFGFFSVFNADAINNISVTKGGFPARYGGRLSSVIDIRMKDGNTEKIKGKVSLGMMSSKLALDGPLYKDKTTFNLSFRRSYFDLFALPLQAGRSSKTAFYFYDSNLKVSHKFSDRSRLYLSLYGGRDKYYTRFNFNKVRNPDQPEDQNDMININDQSYSGWGNVVGSLRLNTIYSDKLFSNISLAYSNYTYFVGYEEHNTSNNDWNYFEQKYYSGISDIMLKLNYDFFSNPKHYIRFGGKYTHHIFNPGIDFLRRTRNNETVLDSTIGGKNILGDELFFYIEDDMKLSSKIKANIGVHSSFYFTGNTTYYSIQPRFSLNYLFRPRFALKISYARMTQYMHLLGSSTVTLPTDLWIPVTDNIKPQFADQISLGIKWQWTEGFTLSLEGYYKKYKQLLSSYNNSVYIGINNVNQTVFSYGKGYSKGLEFLIHKKAGDLTGWLGYTLSKSEQRFSDINNGDYFPMTNDRRHSVGLFTNYKFNSKVDIALTWSLGSGNYITLPTEKFYVPQLPTEGNSESNSYSELYGKVNGFKMPISHRLDVGINFNKEIKYGQRTWSFGLFNAYGSQNAFSVYFDTDINSNGEEIRQLKQLSIFPIPIPYIRYTLKF